MGYQLAVSLPYALVVGFVAVEVAWVAVASGRGGAVLRSAATATGMAAGAFVVGVAYTAALRPLWAACKWDTAAVVWRAHPVAGALVTFVAWDFAGWVYHVVGHRTRLGWAAHQPHHTGEEFDATLALRQTWAPFHGLAIQPLLAVAGFDLRTAFVCAAISNCWQALEHTSVPVRFPAWFERHVMTPAAHRHHHGRDDGGGRGPVNLGPVFTWWDRLAGTWADPATTAAPAAYGRPASANPIAVEAAGWVSLLGGAPARTARLARRS